MRGRIHWPWQHFIPRSACSSIRHRQSPWKGNWSSRSMLTTTPKRQPSRSSGTLVRRFINPWIDAVSQRDPFILGDRIDRYTEGFAVVSTLLCALSAAALANIPQSQHDKKKETCTCNSVLAPLLKQTVLLPLSMLSSSSSSSSSADLDGRLLHDTYVIACCTSFFSAACALGLSTILNVVGTVAPRSYIPNGLIVRHSLALSSIPMFATLSGGFMGLALVIGIDMAACSPTLTFIATGQLGFTVVLVAGTALRAQIGLVRAITAAANGKLLAKKTIIGRRIIHRRSGSK
jgi:hypothetical protein